MLQIVTNCNNKMDKRGRIILSIAIISAILISIFYLCLVIANPENNWIIEDNKVYVDNNNIRISAAPHTLHESSYVYFNIISKVYEGNADLILGFDTPLVSPTKAELYKPELKTITNSYTCNSNFNYTTEPKHAWCYIQNNQTQELELIYEHDFETLDLEKKTIYWEKSYLQEWKDYTNTLTSTSYNFEGINEWYYIKNIPIQKNKEYLFRSLINIPRKSRFSPMPVDIKYWAAIKPSGETLQQAISNNHLYYLDPWVNSSGQDQNKDYLDTGLVHYYKFDDSGTTAEDSVNSNNLTGLGGTWETGLINKSYLETGDEAIDSGYNLSSFSGSDSEFSVCGWYYRTGTIFDSNNYGALLGNSDGNTNENGEFEFISEGPLNKVFVYLYASSLKTLGGVTPPLNTWTMLCFTFDGTTATFYVNNTVNGTATADDFDSSGEAINMHFFARSNEMLYLDNLTFDELGMWNRSLNNTEISDLYNNGAGITYSINNPPSIPTQLEPENASGFAMNSTITFIWDNSVDLDGDTITYDLEIYNESDMAAANLIYSNTSISEGTSNTSISILLSDYTTKDYNYYWHVRANDSNYASDWSPTWTFQYANWTITFNLTDSASGGQIDTSGPQYHFDISCNNGFSISDVDNPYTATDFGVGTVECTFSELRDYDDNLYFSETEDLIINSDKTIEISMSKSGGLTSEEHTWLEELYGCIINGNCTAYDLWENTWKRITKTNRGVVTQEEITSYVLNSTSNITINYTIDVPYKEGYDEGEYLPLRLFFWFTDADKTQCYNQDKRTDSNRAEDPYCFPLVSETLGPNNGSITFTVDLRPSLNDGTYNITRAIEIDPVIDGEQIWTNYGQEDIGQVKVKESNIEPAIRIDNSKETPSRIIGAVIGAGENLLSGWQLVATFAIIGLVLIVFIVSKTLIKLRN